jgi:hypothetical protein
MSGYSCNQDDEGEQEKNRTISETPSLRSRELNFFWYKERENSQLRRDFCMI